MSNKKESNAMFWGFVLGAIGGAAFALLRTPRSGREIRGEISSQASRLTSRGQQAADQTWQSTYQAASSVQQQAADAAASAQQQASDATEAVQAQASETADAVADAADSAADAVDSVVDDQTGS